MRKRIGLMTMLLLMVILIATIAAACNRNTPEEAPKVGRGIDVSFLKDLTFDLDGVTSLAIEKRATVHPAATTGGNVAYADEVAVKNKLVGETEDREVIEITLRNRLGEIYKQDDIQAEFNKLCVSGEFIYFELIPTDVAEMVDENGLYPYYTEDAYGEDGELKEGAELSTVFIDRRDRYTGSALVEFEKSSGLTQDYFFNIASTIPRDDGLVSAFVYSTESDKIYDLSDMGYEVIGKDVVGIDRRLSRVFINEDGEYETKELFNDYSVSRVGNIRVDRWGNVFGQWNTSQGDTEYIDAEARVFVEKYGDWDFTKKYAIDAEGNSVCFSRDGTVKWITETGEFRDPQSGDNFVQKKIRKNGRYWEGITDGVVKYYCYPIPLGDLLFQRAYRMVDLDWTWMLNSTTVIAFVDEVNGETEKSPYVIWFDINDSAVEEADGKLLGVHIITNNFFEHYPTIKQQYGDYDIDTFITINQDGETTYKFYWDAEEQTVKIRLQEENIAPPKEIKKFQPIGG